MIQIKTFKLADEEKEINEFISSHILKGPISLNNGICCIFYEVDVPGSNNAKIQYLRGMYEAHLKKQWEYEEQLHNSIALRDLWDKEKEEENKAWIDANNTCIPVARMLEMEILNTKTTLKMLKALGVDIEHPHVEVPVFERHEPRNQTINDIGHKLNQGKKK